MLASSPNIVSSRFADAYSITNQSPSAIDRSSTTTSVVAVRPNVWIGVTQRRHSSTAFGRDVGLGVGGQPRPLVGMLGERGTLPDSRCRVVSLPATSSESA